MNRRNFINRAALTRRYLPARDPAAAVGLSKHHTSC